MFDRCCVNEQIIPPLEDLFKLNGKIEDLVFSDERSRCVSSIKRPYLANKNALFSLITIFLRKSGEVKYGARRLYLLFATSFAAENVLPLCHGQSDFLLACKKGTIS